MTVPILELVDVVKRYSLQSGESLTAVDGVSFDVQPGRTVGIIGESGSGKSTIARLILGLTPITSGEIRFNGIPIASDKAASLKKLRAQLGFVFQEPFESLNPSMTVARIVSEPLKIHHPRQKSSERRERVLEVFDQVGLRTGLADRHPAALSGGQQQRVGIARALVNHPKIVILDEPTSSLDLSSRAQVLNLLIDLKAELDVSYLFITHDMDTVAYTCDEVHVMNRGRIVESGPRSAIMGHPEHEYTQALMKARLSLDGGKSVKNEPRTESMIKSSAGLKRLVPASILTREKTGAKIHHRAAMDNAQANLGIRSPETPSKTEERFKNET